MNKNDNDSVTVEILAGATLALMGGSVLAIPFYGFAPLVASLAGIAALAAAGRAIRRHEKDKKQTKPQERPKV